MAFDDLPVETDPDVLTDQILDGLVARIGNGYTPVEGDPIVALAEEFAQESAALRQLLQQGAALAVATGFGVAVLGVAPLLGAAATLPALITTSGPGAVVPDGFTVLGTTADGIDVAFTLPGGAIAAADGTAAVVLQALEVGSAGNGVPAGPLTITTTTTTVYAVDATAASGGGRDDELLQDYLDRLADRAQLLKPGGVLAADLAELARTVPGVHRALGLDNYDALTDTDGVARTATVYAIDEQGLPVSQAAADQVQALLESVREVNFVVRQGNPTYTRVQVEFTAVAETGADPVAVQEAVRAAGLAFLDPGSYGGSGDPDRPTWTVLPVVRYLELSRAMGSAPGVAYLSDVTLNGARGDLPLPGRAPLPTRPDAAMPTTVTGTVT